MDLWLGDLDVPAGLRKPGVLLSPDERTRAARLRRALERRRFVAGRARLRGILGSYLALPAASVRFRRTETGKPVLEPDAGLGFSVSHTANVLLIGVGTGPVGVDVELERPVPDLDAVAEMAFTPRERDRAARRGFFPLWTAKEAVLKGLGHGFSLDPRAVELRPAAGGFRARVGGDARREWSVVSLTVVSAAGDRAWGAVAAPGAAAPALRMRSVHGDLRWSVSA